ncbi:MAG: hypothetical protein R6X20_13145 [Phycisphaerae bacterium]
MRRSVTLLAWGLGCFAVGFGVGTLLLFTALQGLSLSVSLCLFVAWMHHQAGPEDVPFLSHPAAGLTVFAVFTAFALYAFFARPTDTSMLFPGWEYPRTLSAFLSVLPAVPYGLTSLGRLVAGEA